MCIMSIYVPLWVKNLGKESGEGIWISCKLGGFVRVEGLIPKTASRHLLLAEV